MPWRRSALLLGAVALSAAACGRDAAPPPAVPAPERAILVRLEPGPGERRELAGGTVHVYPFELKTGWLLHLSLEQQGVDLVARVLAPDGSELFKVDSPTGTQGSEDVWLVADRTDIYRVEVKAEPGHQGDYRARIGLLRLATEEDRAHAAAEKRYYQARGLETTGASRAELEEMYLEAARSWNRLKRRKREGDAWDRLGRLRSRDGDGPGALKAYLRSRDLYQAAGDRRSEALALDRIADVHQKMGSLDEAASARQESLPLWQALGEVANQVSAVQKICQASQLRLRTRETLDCYERVFKRLGALGMRRSQGIVRLDMGALYVSLGDLDMGLATYREALPLLRGDRAARVAVLTQLGNAYLWARASHRALTQFNEALALSRSRESQAVALNGMGLAFRQAGRFSEASLAFRQALALFQQLGNLPGQATVWHNVGLLRLDQGQPLPALEALQRGLELAAVSGHREVQLEALAGMARAELLKGNRIAARDRIERALEVIESVRADTGARERDFSLDLLKATYLASRQDDYAFLIDLLQESGDDAQALQVSERARARSLSDALAPLEGSETPAALTLREIQESVLDDDTVLLEYSLGEEKSHLWWVSRTGHQSFELPGREVLEAAVRKLHRLVIGSHRRGSLVAARRQAEQVSDLLLGPVADRLTQKRLLIVAPDALQVVPFAILPLPGQRGSGNEWPVSLTDRHVVVRAPSASVLARLRMQRSGREQPSRLLTLLGDPVTSSTDDRLPAGIVDPRPEEALSRLRYAGDEIRAILELARGAEVSVATGFEAVPEAITEGGPVRTSILHLVAHGLLDEESPEDSAILLSRFDRRGRPREGRLRAGEIRGLDLQADLVVLSACQTGLGREVRGEGLVGLTHSFLAAGASAVVVSLWKVDDHATKALMERYYRAMLVDGRPPDEALREAKLSLRRETRWRSPYHWGGFIHVGDWLNNPPSGVSP